MTVEEDDAPVDPTAELSNPIVTEVRARHGGVHIVIKLGKGTPNTDLLVVVVQLQGSVERSTHDKALGLQLSEDGRLLVCYRLVAILHISPIKLMLLRNIVPNPWWICIVFARTASSKSGLPARRRSPRVTRRVLHWKWQTNWSMEGA